MREERSARETCIGTMLSRDLSVCLPSLAVLNSKTNEIVCDSLMNEIVTVFYAHYFYIDCELSFAISC